MSEQYLDYVEKKLGRRIACFFELIDQTGAAAKLDENTYMESLLTMEVRQYFSELARIAPEWENEENQPRLRRVCELFQLDAFEQMCLELCLLGEINPYFEKFFIYMNNDWNCGYMTFDTAIRLYTLDWETKPEFYRYFTEDSKLAVYFMHIVRERGKGRVRWGLRCRDVMLCFLLSGSSEFLQETLAVSWYERVFENKENTPLPPIYQKLDRFFGEMGEKVREGVYFSGCSENTGLSLVKGYGKCKKRPVCLADIRRLAMMPPKADEGENRREACLDIIARAIYKNALVCVSFIDRAFIGQAENLAFVQWLAKLFKKHGLPCIFIGEPGCMEAADSDMLELTVMNGEQAVSVDIWRLLADGYLLADDVSLDFLANIYDFNAIEVEQILRRAEKMRMVQGDKAIGQQQLKASCIAQIKCHGNHLVKVENLCYCFEDLVLPKRQTAQLKAACDRVRYRKQVYEDWGFGGKMAYGTGVTMVFSGPPGTGKTMSAAVMANTLAAALYRVDLSAVVSKYIGETEKNLNMVFEMAARGKGVLFFDEADVLFGRRTQVKDSRDKHSNMEAAYLLQRMEEYDGVVILATNYIQNMDEAFRRRIRFFVEFTLPDEDCRKLLWEKAFPSQCKFYEPPDYDFLAKQFTLSGSSIKSIALQAAFYAAGEEMSFSADLHTEQRNRGVGMEHIVKALLEETRKEGRRIAREELKQYSIYYH